MLSFFLKVFFVLTFGFPHGGLVKKKQPKTKQNLVSAVLTTFSYNHQMGDGWSGVWGVFALFLLSLRVKDSVLDES